jgi:hypothetical protein
MVSVSCPNSVKGLRILKSYSPPSDQVKKPLARVIGVLPKMRPLSSYTSAPVKGNHMVYHWKGQIFAGKASQNIGNAETCILLLRHKLNEQSELLKCINLDCLWSTASSDTAACCIKIIYNFLSDFQILGKIGRIPSDRGRGKIKKKTPPLGDLNISIMTSPEDLLEQYQQRLHTIPMLIIIFQKATYERSSLVEIRLQRPEI